MTVPIDPLVKAQYEAYPYPTRRPEDEKSRLIEGTPSALGELEHYVFGGRLPKTLNLLSAGGGTGDAAIMMAQHMKDRGIAGAVTHLDLSRATQDIAKARAKVRGLDITFVQDSLLNAAKYGPFDYIDCCGVLHHLDSPTDGLKALKAALAPAGGIGVMLYAPYGRTGVYPLQSALRTLTEGLSPPEKVQVARKLINTLPDSNWLKRNPLITDHHGSDAGVYDLLLHSTDRAYTVAEVQEFVAAGGMEFISFTDKVRYDPATFIRDPLVLARLPADRFERAGIAEAVSGLIYKHVFYVAHPGRAALAEAQMSPDMAPFYKVFDGAGIGRKMKPGEPVTGTLPGLQMTMTMPRLAGLIMSQVDGVRTWRQVHAALAEKLGRDAPDFDTFWTQAGEVWARLHGINVMLLRQPEGP